MLNHPDLYEQLPRYERMVHNMQTSCLLLGKLEQMLSSMGRKLYALAPLSDGASYRIALTGDKVADADDTDCKTKCNVFLDLFTQNGMTVEEVELTVAPVTLNVTAHFKGTDANGDPIEIS